MRITLHIKIYLETINNVEMGREKYPSVKYKKVKHLTRQNIWEEVP